MFTTLLTKRRAVDHCLVRSSLCRISWRITRSLPSSRSPGRLWPG